MLCFVCFVLFTGNQLSRVSGAMRFLCVASAAHFFAL